MGSSRPPDRSLSSGISFPQWMKGKVDSRFDFDQGAFSPPSHDDTFFYISYPKFGSQVQKQQQEGFQSITTVLSDQKTTNNDNTTLNKNNNIVKSITPGQQQQQHQSQQFKSTESQYSLSNKNNVDLSRHPPSCQSFVNLVNEKEYDASKSSKFINGNKTITKSQLTTDNELHSEAGLCGKSIVNVANRIMSHAIGKKVDTKNINTEINKMDNSEVKKGSKSLPVSPIATPISTPDSSPKSRRRLSKNRFFTGAFIPERDKHQSGWILSSILNSSREVIGDKINEEDELIDIVPVKQLSRKKSISSQNLTYVDDKFGDNKIKFQAEPSELREMNFWSPTSM